MKQQIIIKSADLFLNLGFKSVTMDDIAHEMGISKKTIYQHFDNKTKLVEAAMLHVFENVACGIDHIRELNVNPIEEIFKIKQFVMEHLKDEKSSPQYQLQKYYPKIYAGLRIKQFEVMQSCVKQNLQRGVELGLYRDSINIEFVSRIYFNGMLALKDQELFPLKKFSMNALMEHYLEYHLRGICSPKGVEFLSSLNQLKPTN